jgi:hypothetical protein
MQPKFLVRTSRQPHVRAMRDPIGWGAGVMGKRSDFERRPRDFYPTPEAAVLPLLPHLYGSVRFDEPCVGDGALIRHLEKHGHTCIASGDVATGSNALDISATPAKMFITNPPWSRDILPIADRTNVVAV